MEGWLKSGKKTSPVDAFVCSPNVPVLSRPFSVPPPSSWRRRADHTQPFSVASRNASARLRAPSLLMALLR